MVKILCMKVTKGLQFRDAQPAEETAVVELRTFFGWNFAWEMWKKEWDLIGSVMGWNKK